MTTVNQIREWLKQAEPEHTHMLVVCDTYDWSDYPVFTNDPKQAVKDNHLTNMQKVMEVYDLRVDIEEQLKPGTRVWNAPRIEQRKTSEREGWRYADELEQERKRLVDECSKARSALLGEAGGSVALKCLNRALQTKVKGEIRGGSGLDSPSTPPRGLNDESVSQSGKDNGD